jgi:DNA-binding Lrp family transcriptional regulator
MTKQTRLDRIDLKILSELQTNGRITNAALADTVGLSQSPCLQRVKRLETAGFIVGYGARLDVAKLSSAIIVFTEITLSDHRREDFIAFEAGIATFPQALECHLISGGYDYLVKFVAGSVADYQALIERVLEARIGIEKYFSYIVIKSPLPGRPVPIDEMVDRP